MANIKGHGIYIKSGEPVTLSQVKFVEVELVDNAIVKKSGGITGTVKAAGSGFIGEIQAAQSGAFCFSINNGSEDVIIPSTLCYFGGNQSDIDTIQAAITAMKGTGWATGMDLKTHNDKITGIEGTGRDAGTTLKSLQDALDNIKGAGYQSSTTLKALQDAVDGLSVTIGSTNVPQNLTITPKLYYRYRLLWQKPADKAGRIGYVIQYHFVSSENRASTDPTDVSGWNTWWTTKLNAGEAFEENIGTYENHMLHCPDLLEPGSRWVLYARVKAVDSVGGSSDFTNTCIKIYDINSGIIPEQMRLSILESVRTELEVDNAGTPLTINYKTASTGGGEA